MCLMQLCRKIARTTVETRLKETRLQVIYDNKSNILEAGDKGLTFTCLTEFIPTKIVEISLFDKLYCKDNFDMFFPFSLQ